MRETATSCGPRDGLAAGAAGREQASAVPLEVCEKCFSDLVQPLDGNAVSADDVEIVIHCPECEHLRVAGCSRDEARRLLDRFASARAALRTACDELARENFRDELDCLVLALHAGLIGPDDFAPYRFKGRAATA